VDIKFLYKISRIMKKNWLILAFLLFLPFLFFGYQSVKGDYDFDGVQSRIELYYGDEFYDFKTNARFLDEALVQQGLAFYLQDEFSIDRNTELKGDVYKVFVKKSLPIIIKDEERIIKGRTVHTDPEGALRQNNISYWPEDIISTELILNPVFYGGVGRLISIQRAPVYYIKVDGKKIEVRSWSGLVSELVEKSGVKLNPNDTLVPAKSSILTTGAEIIITRINYAEVTETESIPYQTTISSDYFVPEGRSVVSRSGSNGSLKKVYRVTYKDGKEVGRNLVSSSVTKNPVTAIIKKGVMPSGRAHFNRVYWDIMVAAGTKYGVNPVDMFTVAFCESRLNRLSVSGLISGKRYWGLYQYQSTGMSYSGGLFTSNARRLGFDGMDWSNARAQIYVTAHIVSSEGGWYRWGCKP